MIVEFVIYIYKEMIIQPSISDTYLLVNMQRIAGLTQTKSGISFPKEGENIGIA